MSLTREERFERVATGVAALLLAFAGFALWHSNGAPSPPRAREVRVAWRCADGSAKRDVANGNADGSAKRDVANGNADGSAKRDVANGNADGSAKRDVANGNAQDGGACSVVTDVERCTTCHEPTAHTKRAILIDAHATIGCVACHGGDGLALGRDAAHDGLAKRGSETSFSEVQARCAACHVETRAFAPSPAKAAWARWMATRDHAIAPPPEPARDETEEAPQLAAGRALFRALRCGACHVARDSSPLATPLDVLGLRGTPSQLARGLEKHEDRGAIDLGLDEIGTVAVAARLVAIESGDASTAMQHRASVAGSSADEGRTLYDKLACAACHTPGSGDGRLHVDLGNMVSWRTPDWVAFYLSDPAHANPSTAMPSLRLSAREASSLAQHVVPRRLATDGIDAQATTGRNESIACRLPRATEAKTMTRDACGEAIIAAANCVSCHTTAPARSAPSLARFGEGRDSSSAALKLVDHAGYRLARNTKRDVLTYLLSQRQVRVRPDLLAPAHEGSAAFESLGCAGCHALDALATKTPGPSLFGEGLRTQPQWLFEFLRAPQRHAVRPSLHPEWAYRDLVPADHVTPRMPTFPLDEATTTSLVRFFVERDGASFPYAAVPQIVLGGDALTNAIADVTHKDRGACLGCHTIATPDVARARESEGKLAPPLALAHDRLRPAWIEACLAQPDAWVMGMPALDKPIDEIDRVRDLVLALRERTVLPPPGAEGQIPALGLGDLP